MKHTTIPIRGVALGREKAGGVIVNQAPHQFDLLSWFMGPVFSVSGNWINANHPYLQVDDSAVATICFKNGGVGSIFVSNSQKPGLYAKVYVHGSSGASIGIQTDGGAMFIAGRSKVLEPPFNDLWTIPGQEGFFEKWKQEDKDLFSSIDATWYFFSLQVDDFAHAVAMNETASVTGDDGREVVKIIEGIYESSKTHQSVFF
ncbi:MAG: hypothetical protein LLF89_07900 [Spirochaetaceae bacterium]|nr:hypothetical protein [Spirochaetaceae bacterium]